MRPHSIGTTASKHATPELYLQTGFVLNAEGRIVSTREPAGERGPLFSLVRGSTSCAWAVRSDVSAALAHELDSLARAEPPALDVRDPPLHAQRYLELLASRSTSGESVFAATKTRRADGPNFSFPESLPKFADARHPSA
jgi:hypothetical protein